MLSKLKILFQLLKVAPKIDSVNSADKQVQKFDPYPYVSKLAMTSLNERPAR